VPGLIGQKKGMTQIFSADGRWLPVTVLKAGPCSIVQKKTKAHEGYDSLQVGFADIKDSRLTKAAKGHFLKKQLVTKKYLKEFRTNFLDSYPLGVAIDVDFFQIGDMVNVVGVSKGKGFQGVMKRHHFAGGRATHGCSVSHRAPGSIGQRTYPGKVFKGKRMAGRMGGEQVSSRHLKIVGIEKEQNLLLIRGSVPGGKNSVVTVKPTDQTVEKRYIETLQKKAS